MLREEEEEREAEEGESRRAAEVHSCCTSPLLETAARSAFEFEFEPRRPGPRPAAGGRPGVPSGLLRSGFGFEGEAGPPGSRQSVARDHAMSEAE